MKQKKRNRAVRRTGWLGELEAEWRNAKRRKRIAARRMDHRAADEAQTDEAALKHVIDMMRRRSPIDQDQRPPVSGASQTRKTL